jgi:sugar/nucleoside kinase (ribokinase family)
MYYAMECRKHGILTSLDGGRLRANTDELLNFIDVAVVSELLCEEMALTPSAMLGYLRNKGCRVGAVTLGSEGVLWYAGDQHGQLDAYPVAPEKVIDTNGAGDVFHGSYMFSYLRNPKQSWEDHFRFASVAAALSIQHLGIEAGLPTLASVEAAMRACGPQAVDAIRP